MAGGHGGAGKEMAAPGLPPQLGLLDGLGFRAGEEGPVMVRAGRSGGRRGQGCHRWLLRLLRPRHRRGWMGDHGTGGSVYLRGGGSRAGREMWPPTTRVSDYLYITNVILTIGSDGRSEIVGPFWAETNLVQFLLCLTFFFFFFDFIVPL